MKSVNISIALLFFLIAYTNIISAQAPTIEWQKCLGGGAYDYGQSVKATRDGGYIVAGFVESRNGDVAGHNGGMYDYWLVKLNSSGSIQWSKCLGGTNFDQANDLIQTSDGGYMVAGTSRSSDLNVTVNYGDWDYWIVKLSSSGNIEWEKSYGGDGVESAISVQQTTDGGYIIAGVSSSNGFTVGEWHGATDYWIIKIDEKGKVQWQKGLGGAANEAAESIKQTADGGYIIAGSSVSGGFMYGGQVGTNHSEGGYHDYWLVKINSKGTIEWQKSYGGSYEEIAHSVACTPDGGYIIVGSCGSEDGDITGHHGSVRENSADCWVVKVSANGNLQWQKSIGGTGNDFGYSVIVNSDGSYTMAGQAESDDGDVTGYHRSGDAWIINLDQQGNIKWQKCYGGFSADDAKEIEQTADGGYIFAGSTSSTGRGDVTGLKGNVNYWVVKLRPESCTPTINITPSSTNICAGNPVTFTAAATDTGSKPFYQWKLNGANVGNNTNIYTSSELKDNDIVVVELISNASCATDANVTSNPIKITVKPAPVVSITGDSCVGSVLTANSNTTPLSLMWTLNDTIKLPAQSGGLEKDAILYAGGNGEGSDANQLSNPNRLCMDATGNLYIADIGNNRIQKWASEAASGITVAGGNGAGSAANQFNRPTSVFLDSHGNIYVTDQQNGRVQKWAPGATTGETFVSGLASPTAIFIDAADNIYISEQNNSAVKKFPAGSNMGITVAGGNGYGNGANQLSSPTGIFVDEQGNIFICDTDNGRVQKWAPGATSAVTVAGGNGYGSDQNQLESPLGVFVDGAGNMYVADRENSRVTKWAPGATSGETVAVSNSMSSLHPQLESPTGIWMDTNNNLYVSDYFRGRVLKYTSTPTNTYTTSKPGNYTATIVSGNGCSATSGKITIVPLRTPQVSITSNITTVCPGVVPVFRAAALYGGDKPLFQWKVNNVNIGPNSSDSTFRPSEINNMDVVTCLMTSSLNTCLTAKTAASNSVTLTKTLPDVPLVTITATDTSICKGSKITFTAYPVNAGTNPAYQWKVNGANIVLANNTSTFSSDSLQDGDVVSCGLTGKNLCSLPFTTASNNIAIHVISIPAATISISASDTVICTGSNVNFVAKASNYVENPVYQWKVNGINAGGNNAFFYSNSFKNGDVVNCTITSNMQCAAPSTLSNSVRITVDEIPVIAMMRDTVVFTGSSIKLKTAVSGNIATYLWSPEVTLSNPTTASPLATPTETTTYKLRVTTHGGCEANGEVIISTTTGLAIPNTFTPNNDGINDVWKIRGLSSYVDCSVQIFNRYGVLLFEAKGYDKAWDGTFKGQPLSAGTYYYIISMNTKYRKITGSVTILR